MKKLQKLKNGKLEKKNKNIDFWLNPYVKNGIFEKKITLVKHFFMKKLFNLKILHEKKTSITEKC